MTGHLLALEHLAGVLALAGRTVRTVRDGDAVRRAQASEVVPLHNAGEALADALRPPVDLLAGDEVIGRQFGAPLDQRVLGAAELDEPQARESAREGKGVSVRGDT